MPVRQDCSSKRHGLSLAEVVVSSLLVGLLMTTSLLSVGAALKSANVAVESSDGIALAQKLVDEITMQAFKDPNQTATFGLESGESLGPDGRTTTDDVDDFNGWTDSPPTDRSGNAITGFSGWNRAVVVVDKTSMLDIVVNNVQGSPPELRQIVVTVTSPTGRTYSLTAYRYSIGGSHQSQGLSQTLVTWVGASLQTGSSTEVSGGVSLVNHATDQ